MPFSFLFSTEAMKVRNMMVSTLMETLVSKGLNEAEALTVSLAEVDESGRNITITTKPEAGNGDITSTFLLLHMLSFIAAMVT